MLLLDRQPRRRGRTVGAGKHFDTGDFITVSRDLGFVPHVSQNLKRAGGSAIDARTTRHSGYAQSQACRPRIERVFACAAFNLKRLPRLLTATA